MILRYGTGILEPVKTTMYKISDGAQKLIDQEAERLKSVPNGIAARLIGCNSGLISKYISAGRLTVLPTGQIPIEQIENMAARPICPYEIKLCENELDLENQLLAIRYRLKVHREDFTDEWSEAND